MPNFEPRYIAEGEYEREKAAEPLSPAQLKGGSICLFLALLNKPPTKGHEALRTLARILLVNEEDPNSGLHRVNFSYRTPNSRGSRITEGIFNQDSLLVPEPDDRFSEGFFRPKPNHPSASVMHLVAASSPNGAHPALGRMDMTHLPLPLAA
jgi:hypothetical protein